MLRVALVTLLTVSVPAPSSSIDLPSPEAAKVQQSNLITAVGGRPDRLLTSVVPGPVVNDETVQVGLAGDGSVRTVTAEQRLRLTGTGDYAVRERGPARSARSLSADPPPVTRRGAVVWQGFSPGSRDLAASLTLDPQIEGPHLPLAVRVTGVSEAGRVDAAGTVTLTLTNTTSQPTDLPTATDAPAAALATPLDRALAVARHPSAARLPTTEDLLPPKLTVTGGGAVGGAQAVPLRVVGALHLTGTTGTLSGPATTPDGTFAGTLGGVNGTASVTFTLAVTGPGTLALDLTAVNALSPVELTPPRGLPSWKAWAASSPPQAERHAALDLLVEVAAAGARASSYSPYLGADLKGTGSTTFAFTFAPASQAATGPAVLHPRWGRLGLAGVGFLMLVGAAGWVWRRS